MNFELKKVFGNMSALQERFALIFLIKNMAQDTYHYKLFWEISILKIYVDG